jgi:hypothetical protein
LNRQAGVKRVLLSVRPHHFRQAVPEYSRSLAVNQPVPSPHYRRIDWVWGDSDAAEEGGADYASAAYFGGQVRVAVGIFEVCGSAGGRSAAFERRRYRVDHCDTPQPTATRVAEDRAVADSQRKRTAQQHATVGVAERAVVHGLRNCADVQH